MDDKQVGEQWRLWTRVINEDGHQPMTYAHAARFLQFINKLVEERAGSYYYKDGNYATQWHELAHHGKAGEIVKQQYAGYALRDFGINPADYKD